jgi:parallel beta-helix repeat protein
MQAALLLRKGVTLGTILLFIGTAVFPSNGQQLEKLSVPMSRGVTLYVGGTGPGNYTKIQDAIDNASNGDTVFVYDDSSPYYEHVKIQKSITLLGENRETTIIDANENGSPIILEANNVTVRGFTIQKSGYSCFLNAGIYIKNSGEASDSNNNKIIGNNIIQNHHGFYGYHSKNNNISDNVMIGNDHGAIYCDGCDSTIIQNNTITENCDGVWIWESKFVQVNRNTIDDNYEFGVLFDGFSQVSTFHQVKYNSITRHKFGLTIWSEHNMVEHNYIANNSFGVLLKALGMYGARWNVVRSNTIANSTTMGLLLEGATWCKILKNNFIENTVHATFYYWLPTKMIAPLFGRFLQMNKFFYNYWDDDNMTSPRMIQGQMVCYVLLSVFLLILYDAGFIHTPPDVEPKYVQWKNYDWFPAEEPYDIGE